MFKSLLSDLDFLRRKTARFRRVALHVHSPDSHDWGREAPDPLRNQRSRFDGNLGLTEYSSELRPHLDLVAITDHMRCTFASQLSNHITAPDEFCVLPGMEVNLKLDPPLNFARIHLLAILPEKSTNQSFACLFSNQGHIPRDDARRNGQEEVKGLSLKDWVKRVHDEKGLCIAAHVENQQGVRYCFRQTAKETLSLFYDGGDATIERENNVPETFKDYLFESSLDGIEIHKSSDATHYRWISEKDGRHRSISTVLTFDAHYCENFDQPDRTTHIKMTSLSLTGLENALRFPDTRIRFPDNLPPAPNPQLLGISVSGDENSFFEDVKIALAENLNCLIGVRGSGKSTVVEALRYVFGYNRTLYDLGKPMEDNIRGLQRATLPGSLIRVAYRLKSDEIRILSATFDDKDDYVTKVYNESGDLLEVANVEESGDYPLRLFGWSEIETLGRSPARQRDLLDRLVPELPGVLRRRDLLRQQLSQNRGVLAGTIAKVKAIFEKDGGEITRYKEYLADFEKLNTEPVKNLFSPLDLANAKKRILDHVKGNTDSIGKALVALSPVTLRSELDEALEKGSAELRDWWLKEELNELGLVAVEVGVEKDIREASEKLQTCLRILASRMNIVVQQIEDSQRALQETLEESADDSMQRIADLRANAESRLRRVSDTRTEYLKAWQDLEVGLQERRQICRLLLQTQHEIAGIRVQYNGQIEKTLNRFLPKWMVVSISFKAGADKDEFGKTIASVVPGQHRGQIKRTRLAVQDIFNPVSCAEAILDENVDDAAWKEVVVGQERIELSDEDVSTWFGTIRPFEHNEHADVPALSQDGRRLEALLQLQETPWDDFEMILLDGDPVNEKSPGQRSSAMLPLIALAEDTPLVIDQPEDNLDKRLIGGVLMKVLAELKEKRQITVCTHDPNILVGGDAEQVVVLEAKSNRKSKVVDHGSIDNDSIVKTVIDLLEGGAEAFAARQRRYGLPGENVGS